MDVDSAQSSASAPNNAIEQDECIYATFMHTHYCYDVIPTSTKLVVFDTQMMVISPFYVAFELQVRKAFYALINNSVRAAPLFDSQRQAYVGMLTITDFIQILYKYYKRGAKSGLGSVKELELHRIESWKEVMLKDDNNARTPFIWIDPEETLFKAVQVLCENHIHRLPVLDKATGSILYILTHKRLIKYLITCVSLAYQLLLMTLFQLPDMQQLSFMRRTPRDLGIGTWDNVETITRSTPIIDALALFLGKRVSALPVVDDDGRLVDIYAKFDVLHLAADGVYNDLHVTIGEALDKRRKWFEGVCYGLETDSIASVVDSLVDAGVHRLVITNDKERVIGVVSLSDILSRLILYIIDTRPLAFVRCVTVLEHNTATACTCPASITAAMKETSGRQLARDQRTVKVVYGLDTGNHGCSHDIDQSVPQ